MCLRDELQRLAAAYRAGSALALLFDYDGTLAPIVTHPALAECPSGTLQILSRFADLPRVRVGIISSRELADLKTMVHLPKLIYAGTSGLELEENGVVQIHPAANQYRPFLRSAAKSLASVIGRFSGAWIEVKRFAMTLHYRNVNRDETPFLKQSASLALRQFDHSLTTVDGSMALEILPDLGWSKGESLRQIMDSQPSDCLPFYAGNDANDAEALQIAADLGGVAVGIGPFAPYPAQHRLPDTESLAESLLSLHLAVEGKLPMFGKMPC
jgi:trehalose 6-phosphate phosphatase